MESDVIEHLVGIEHKATTLLDDATKEAQHRIAIAKSTAEKQYKEKYEKIIEKLEKEYTVKTSLLTDKHTENIKMYKKAIQNFNMDKKGFQNLLDKLILEA